MVEKGTNSTSDAEIIWEGSRTVEITSRVLPVGIRFEFQHRVMDELNDEERETLEQLLCLVAGSIAGTVALKDVISDASGVTTDYTLGIIGDKVAEACNNIDTFANIESIKRG